MLIRSATLYDLLEVLNILNRAAKDLHSKGIHQWEYPWDEKVIRQQIQNQYLFTLLENEKYIGTFGLRDLHSLSDCVIEPGSKYLFQIAILPEYQGKSYGKVITDWVCTYVKERNISLYLDCWAGNDKLKTFYKDNGLRYMGIFQKRIIT